MVSPVFFFFSGIFFYDSESEGSEPKTLQVSGFLNINLRSGCRKRFPCWEWILPGEWAVNFVLSYTYSFDFRSCLSSKIPFRAHFLFALGILTFGSFERWMTFMLHWDCHHVVSKGILSFCTCFQALLLQVWPRFPCMEQLADDWSLPGPGFWPHPSQLGLKNLRQKDNPHRILGGAFIYFLKTNSFWERRFRMTEHIFGKALNHQLGFERSSHDAALHLLTGDRYTLGPSFGPFGLGI